MKKLIIILVSTLLMLEMVGCTRQTRKNIVLRSSVSTSIGTEINLTTSDVSTFQPDFLSNLPDYSGSPYIILNDNIK